MTKQVVTEDVTIQCEEYLVYKKNLIKLQLEVIVYKKYRTVYRPNLLKVKMEVCSQLKMADHPYFKLLVHDKVEGNMLDPCPMTVRLKHSTKSATTNN